MERSIYIPDPCHVSWKKMTPEEEGRHCAVCDKVVVDFSKKNTVQINDYLENATGKVCGRFSVDQLDHDAQMKVFKKPSNFFNKNWKFAVLAFLGVFAVSRKAEAQKLRGKVMRPVGGAVAYPEKPANPQTKTDKVVSGHISAQDVAHVQGAEVSIVQNDITIARSTTLANGRFVIKLQAGALHGTKVTVKISHPDYPTKERPDVDLIKDKTELSVSLDERYMLKGEIAEPPKTKYHLQGGVSMSQHLKNYPEPEIVKEDTVITCTKVDTSKVEVPEVIMGQVMVMPATNEKITVEVLTKEEEQEYKNTIEQIPVNTEELNMNIYPNPATTYAVLETTLENGFGYEVYTTSGTRVEQGRSSGPVHRIDVSAWTPGTYVCIAREGTRARTLKLVISR